MDRSVDNEPYGGMRGPRDVLLWRRSLLVEAGFVPAVAHELAANPECDLHGLLNLVDPAVRRSSPRASSRRSNGRTGTPCRWMPLGRSRLSAR
jgi:hypothetical protein